MMNKNLLSLLVLPLMFGACKTKCVEDLGIHASKEFTAKPFDEIKVDGPIRLVMRQDSSFKINIQADSAVMNIIKAEVSGHELALKLDPKQYCGQDSVIITAGIGSLKKLQSRGAGHIFTSSQINVNELNLDLSGATKVFLQLNAAKLTTKSDGTANITYVGQTSKHELTNRGALDLHAFDFVSGTSDISSEGVATIKVNVLNQLKINTTGSATISYKGSPKDIDEKKSGTYKLEKVN